MASDIGCDICQAEQAGAMFTNLDNGDTMAIGHSCMITFALTTATELASDMPPDQAGGYADLLTNLLAAFGGVILGQDLAAHDDGSEEYARAVAEAQFEQDPHNVPRKPGRPRKPAASKGVTP